MANFIPATSLFLGIIPALILLFISVKGYEKTIKQKNIFLAFIVGIIIGFIIVVVEIYYRTLPLIYFIVVFPIFEELFKTIILNIRRLQEKPDTVFYGLTLGLGIGSVATSASILQGTLPAGDYLGLALVVIGSCGVIMLQGSTGIIIGYGVFRSKVSQYVLFAIVLHMIFMTGLYTTQIFFQGTAAVAYLFIAGLLLYWYSTKKIMVQILVESQRRKRTQKEIDIKKTS